MSKGIITCLIVVLSVLGILLKLAQITFGVQNVDHQLIIYKHLLTLISWFIYSSKFLLQT